MKRKGEVHNEAAKSAVPCWVGLGTEGASQSPHPHAEWERGQEGEGCGGARLKGLGGRGRWLHLEKGNCGHPLISPACRGLFGRGGKRAGGGWAG